MMFSFENQLIRQHRIQPKMLKIFLCSSYGYFYVHFFSEFARPDDDDDDDGDDEDD